MRPLLAANWWSLVIRGVVGILLGIFTFVWPGITLTSLVLLFGAYALIDGAISLAGAMRAAEHHERWGALLLEGIAGIVVAAITIAWPGITALVLVYLIAGWAVITGIAEIAAAVRLRRHITGEWLLGMSGVLSVIFGVLIAFAPIAGALVIAVWFGVYALIFGIVLVTLGVRLRSWNREIPAGPGHPAPAH
jgi:uncharacterized membrane protein HdeD (DUF308 family)